MKMRPGCIIIETADGCSINSGTTCHNICECDGNGLPLRHSALKETDNSSPNGFMINKLS